MPQNLGMVKTPNNNQILVTGQLAAKKKSREIGRKAERPAQKHVAKNACFICPSRKRLRAEKWISPCSV
jgi:hypothetical protein